jgi:hypothetical protein
MVLAVALDLNATALCNNQAHSHSHAPHVCSREPYGAPHSTAMSDPIDALAATLLPILFGTAQAPPSGRLRPLLVVRPHPKQRLMR